MYHSSIVTDVRSHITPVTDMSMDAAARAARRKVEKAVAAYGGTIEVDYSARYYTVQVQAPKGHHWADGCTHEFVSECFIGPWSYDFVWEDLLPRIASGIEQCDVDMGCEWWEDDA